MQNIDECVVAKCAARAGSPKKKAVNLVLHGRFGLEHLVFAASFVIVFGCKNSWQVLPRPSAGKTALLLLLLLVTLGFLLGSTNHPFLYFQF